MTLGRIAALALLLALCVGCAPYPDSYIEAGVIGRIALRATCDHTFTNTVALTERCNLKSESNNRLQIRLSAPGEIVYLRRGQRLRISALGRLIEAQMIGAYYTADPRIIGDPLVCPANCGVLAVQYNEGVYLIWFLIF